MVPCPQGRIVADERSFLRSCSRSFVGNETSLPARLPPFGVNDGPLPARPGSFAVNDPSFVAASRRCRRTIAPCRQGRTVRAQREARLGWSGTSRRSATSNRPPLLPQPDRRARDARLFMRQHDARLGGRTDAICKDARRASDSRCDQCGGSSTTEEFYAQVSGRFSVRFQLHRGCLGVQQQ